MITLSLEYQDGVTSLIVPAPPRAKPTSVVKVTVRVLSGD